jgi:hypothetical protein
MGFLHSIQPVGTVVAQATGLRVQWWRDSPPYQPWRKAYDWTNWEAAAATGAKMTLILSDLWHQETNQNDNTAAAPWNDWSGYAAWVAKTVRTVKAIEHVDYWEIQNEPGAQGYYNAATWNALTPQLLLEQFLVAYQAIKSVDPNAQVIGPSLARFADYPGEWSPHEFDLVTFLDFVAAKNIKLAGLTWHEIDDFPGPHPGDNSMQPQNIVDHVGKARHLIASHPALGDLPIWINEYGRHEDSAIPGWAVGDLGALEEAQVQEAGRACWFDQAPDGRSYEDCWSPTLDGLFGLNGSSHRALYWVYQAYAKLTGTRVPVSSSDGTISGLAASNTAAHTIRALVGRHVSCLAPDNLNCPETPGAVPAPTSVSLSVRLPWAADSVQVEVARIPATWQLVPAPTHVQFGTVPVTNGVVNVSLPGVADGDAYTLTISG